MLTQQVNETAQVDLKTMAGILGHNYFLDRRVWDTTVVDFRDLFNMNVLTRFARRLSRRPQPTKTIETRRTKTPPKNFVWENPRKLS
jgi:hypothetical protein